MTRRLYVELDNRHRIAREGRNPVTLNPTWAFRFCGDFILSADSRREAETLALQWEEARIAKMLREAGQ